MLKKFIKIKNTGRFKDYNCSGDVEFRKMNIVYGENGAGKTTLVTILRSLRDNNKSILYGRKTLGSRDEQQILISTESQGQIKFDKDGWDKNLKNVEIFDNSFVTENVYSGNYVDVAHKRNLHLWAIGEEGVKLANRIANIDDENREVNYKIRDVENNIREYIKGNYLIELFILLKEDKDIDSKIAAQETILESSKNAYYIKKKPLLNQIENHKINIDGIKEILLKSYSDITEEVTRKVKEHISHNLDDSGEGWIEKGLGYLKTDNCPFCLQNITGVEIIDYYKSYLNKEYKIYKQNLSDKIKELRKTINENYIETIKSSIILNDERLLDWNNIIHETKELHKIDLVNYESVFKNFCSKANELLDLKMNNPIEQIEVATLDLSTDVLNKCNDEFNEYNKLVIDINQTIEQFKNKLTGKPEEEQKKLNMLINIKNRYTNEALKLIKEREKLKDQKNELANEKEIKKGKLTQITNDILREYSEGINKYLSNCGANFKLLNSKVSYLGGKACLDYQIQLNHTSIPLGKEDSPDEIPSFKNTLSEGDKSALAFAFFLANIEKDKAIAQKIVVIDDPISSMDVHRKDTTAYALYRVSQSSLQTLIFTHSPEFAKLVWEKDKSGNKKCLRTEIENESCKIVEWDINKIGMSDYFHHYFLISEFVATGRGVKKSVAQSIRPLLEGYLRFKFPRCFKQDQWLGNYIDMIRNSQGGSEISNLLNQLSELEEINEYSKKFHHDQIDSWSDINSASLKAYSKRALKFCTG